MGRRSASAGKKDPFEALDKEFKDAIEGMDETAIRARIAEVAIGQQQLMDAKENDLDLAEKAALAKEAGAIYSEGTKVNKLKIRFAKQMLESRGKL